MGIDGVGSLCFGNQSGVINMLELILMPQKTIIATRRYIANSQPLDSIYQGVTWYAWE